MMRVGLWAPDNFSKGTAASLSLGVPTLCCESPNRRINASSLCHPLRMLSLEDRAVSKLTKSLLVYFFLILIAECGFQQTKLKRFLNMFLLI